MPHYGLGPFSPAQQASLGVDSFGNHGPEATPGSPGNPEEGTDIEALLEAWRRQQQEEGGRAEFVSETGERVTRGETERDIVSTTTAQFDELIKQVSRVYVDVPTPEEFLDDFSNAFVGYAQDMVEAGMSQGDINLMLDPGTGFMQTMLNEYMGNLAQRAARGEDLFDIAGLEGAPELVGTRPGAVTEQEITRMTRTQAEQVLKERGEEVTNESVQSVIDDDFQQRQSAMTARMEETVVTTTEETLTETGERRFEETEEIFQRPRVTPIFKFSPGEFLQERFGDDLGQLSVQIRGRKGEAARIRQTAAGGPVVSARRT
jgi:hypothetical protein